MNMAESKEGKKQRKNTPHPPKKKTPKQPTKELPKQNLKTRLSSAG